jgi:hypothetical protein
VPRGGADAHFAEPFEQEGFGLTRHGDSPCPYSHALRGYTMAGCAALLVVLATRSVVVLRSHVERGNEGS